MTKTSISTNKTNKSKNQKKPFTIFQAEKRNTFRYQITRFLKS